MRQRGRRYAVRIPHASISQEKARCNTRFLESSAKETEPTGPFRPWHAYLSSALFQFIHRVMRIF